MRHVLDRLLGRSSMRGRTTSHSVEALLADADRARDGRDWAGAAQSYAAAIERGCGNVRVQVQLGHALKELGRYAEAETAYRRFLDETPFDADIHLQLGHLFNRQDDPAAALHWYERALQLAPTDVDIASHLETARHDAQRTGVRRKRDAAMRFVEARRWNQALPILQDLVDSEGEHTLIGILANVTKEAGELADAAGLYERYRSFALSQAPALLADVELQSGHLRKIMGDHRAALKHYIAARDQARLQSGQDAADRTYTAEINACICEIYTCFHLETA